MALSTMDFARINMGRTPEEVFDKAKKKYGLPAAIRGKILAQGLVAYLDAYVPHLTSAGQYYSGYAYDPRVRHALAGVVYKPSYESMDRGVWWNGYSHFSNDLATNMRAVVQPPSNEAPRYYVAGCTPVTNSSSGTMTTVGGNMHREYLLWVIDGSTIKNSRGNYLSEPLQMDTRSPAYPAFTRELAVRTREAVEEYPFFRDWLSPRTA